MCIYLRHDVKVPIYGGVATCRDKNANTNGWSGGNEVPCFSSDFVRTGTASLKNDHAL